MPPNPPVPIKATDIGLAVQIDFDRELIPGPLDTGNWTATINNLQYTMADAFASDIVPGAVVIIFDVPPVPDPKGDSVTYAPPPFDVVSERGIPAAPFEFFPITP